MGSDAIDQTPKPKSYVVPMLLAFLGVGLGFSHVYAGKTTIGAMMLCIAAVGIGLGVSGHSVGWLMVAVVWSVDLVGGLMGVARHNQRLGLPQ